MVLANCTGSRLNPSEASLLRLSTADRYGPLVHCFIYWFLTERFEHFAKSHTDNADVFVPNGWMLQSELLQQFITLVEIQVDDLDAISLHKGS